MVDNGKLTSINERSRVEILCISNGHGEDRIASVVCLELQKLGVKVLALPMVGHGHFYQACGISLLEGSTQAMPSGGFVRMDGNQFWRDLRGGLVGLTWRQFHLAWRWSHQSRHQRAVLAVGDIVPLLIAWLSCGLGGCDYAFIATAKSEYYWRDRQGKLRDIRQPWGGSDFFPWERFLMSARSCRATFVRDELTAEILREEFRLPVLYQGNPMMDGLEPLGMDFGVGREDWAVAMLPGSRPPEAYENFGLLLTCAQIMARFVPNIIHFLTTIAPSLDREKMGQILLQKGWLRLDDTTYKLQSARLKLVSPEGFGDCLHQCHLGLAMAGTATEQLVGLGKPVITIEGNGPQFTPKFARDQVRLLGLSVICIDKPAAIEKVMLDLLHSPDYFQSVVRNGVERMGYPGASQRIARSLVDRVIRGGF